MSLNFENKLKMLKAVQYTLLTNSDITSSFASEVGKYDEYLQRIRELSQKINNNNPDNLPLDLEYSIKQASHKIAAALRGYAAMTSRTDLLTNEHIKAKVIDKSSGEELYQNCLKILEAVRENQVSLSLFGVNERKLSDYENMLYYFKKLKSKEFSLSHVDVEGICEEAEKFLQETIDTLVEQEKINFPRFYNEYKYARTSKEEHVQNLHFFA